MNGHKRTESAFAKILARAKAPPVVRSTAFEGNSLGAVPAVVDHAESLVAGLTRDLANLPSGPKRALECDIRRAEVLEGVGQILHVMDATERAIGEEKEPRNISASERECYAGRLRWAAGMTKGLRQGVSDLVWYDTYSVPGDMYATINTLLSECESRVSRLSVAVEELGPKEEEDPGLAAPADSPAALAAEAAASGAERPSGADGAAGVQATGPEAAGSESQESGTSVGGAAGAESVSEMTRALKQAREEVSAMMASAYSTMSRAEEPEMLAGQAEPSRRMEDDREERDSSEAEEEEEEEEEEREEEGKESAAQALEQGHTLGPAVAAPGGASPASDNVVRDIAPPPLKDQAPGQDFRGSEYDDWMNDFMAKYVHRALMGVSELFSSEMEDIERLFKPNQLPTIMAEERDGGGPRHLAVTQVETY